MDIVKFTQFINEKVMLPVLDCVIDEFGNIYNGLDDRYPLKKGNIVKGTVEGKIGVIDILADDKKSYIAGIDKNGNLVAPKANIQQGFLMDNSGKRIKVPQYIRGTRSKYWKVQDVTVDDIGQETYGELYDYSKLVPIKPTGWVNTKVDMEVVKKVRRYSRGLGQGKGREGFVSKLSDLVKLSTYGLERRKRSRVTIQKEMSVIILLHYINEIKDYFTPSASGFLFESFLGGLIKNSKVVEDNSKADIKADGETWQVKLYDGVSSSSISVAYMDEKSVPKVPVDHFVICLKYADRIDIVVLKGIENELDPLCYKNFLTEVKTKVKDGKTVEVGGNFSLAKLQDCDFIYSIGLLGIEEKIESIAEGLKESIDDIYKDLSQFQYNIESIITGVDENGKLLNEMKFDQTYGDSVRIAQGLDKKITSLYTSIRNQ